MHDATNWTNPAFLQMVTGGIETTSGAVPADCGASVPANYDLVKLDDNTFDPMQLDVSADRKVYYVEREGPIKVIDQTTNHTSTVATLNAFTANESGVLGMALDPNFATNRFMYVYYSPNTSENVDQLSRFTLAADDTFVAGSEKVVLKVPVQRAECCHHGGSMVFDKKTGDLFLATGDNSNPFASDGFAPLDQGAGRAYWDSERTAGNTNSLSGKLLRVHPETDGSYTVPTGNLFAAGTDKTRPEVYGMGFRNPFRINIDPEDRNGIRRRLRPRLRSGRPEPRAAEHGRVEHHRQARQLRLAVLHRPEQCLQPLELPDQAVRREVRLRRRTGQRFPGTTSVVLQDKHHQAEHFDTTGRLAGSTSTGDPGVTIEATSDTAGGTSNIGYIESDDWIAFNRVNLTAIDSISMRVASTVAGGADFDIRLGDPATGPLLGTIHADNTGDWQKYGNFSTALANAPTTTGTIYFVARKAGNTGSLMNVNWIDFIGKGATANERPTISAASVTPTSGLAPVTVQASAAGTDPEGEKVNYHWDFGTTDGATADTAQAQYNYTVPGTYTVTLTVSDPGGAHATQTFSVKVNAPAQGCIGDLSDNFDGNALSPTRWSVIRQNQDLTVADGALHIPTSLTDLYGAAVGVPNIVLQDMPGGAWQATTKVDVKAYTQYQQAGLIVYGDDDNYAKFVVQGRTSNQADRIFQYAHEVAASPSESNSKALGLALPDTVYLRITSDGTNMMPSYSTDGVAWTEADSTWSSWSTIDKTTASLGAHPKIGLVSFANTVGTVTDAAFDSFTLTPDPSAKVDTPDDEFDGSTLNSCRWSVLREDKSKYQVAGGSLQITTTPGELDASNNVLLQDQPAGNHWVLETKVDGEALNQHYQQAGLTAYADGQNYVKLDYITDNDPGTPLKRRFELRTVVGGVVGQPQPSVNDLTSGTWYLRLERTDNNFAGYYSADGVVWTKFSDTVANIPVASSGKVGIFAVGVDQASAQGRRSSTTSTSSALPPTPWPR